MENLEFRWVIRKDKTKYLQWRRLIAHRSSKDIWSDWYDITKEVKEEDIGEEVNELG